MNVRILKKIGNFVKLENDGEEYIVYSRKRKKDEWEKMYGSISLRKALIKKHHQSLIVLRELGYRGEFLKRKSKRKWR